MGKLIQCKLTRYQKILAAVWISSAALLGAGVVFFYLPQHSALEKTRKLYEESREQAALAKKAASPQTRSLLDQQNEKVSKELSVFTIPADQVGSLVFEVGRMAGQLALAGFASKSINVQPAEKTDSKLAEAWLSVEFEGTYEQFARFVNLLERNGPAIFVEKITVRRGSNKEEACQFQMELSILTTSAAKTSSLAAADRVP